MIKYEFEMAFSQTMFGDKVNKSGYVGGLLGMAKVYPIEI